jgi:hypothetical protein
MTERADNRLRMHPVRLRIIALGVLTILAAACGSGTPNTATSPSPSATVTRAVAVAALACHAQATNVRPREHALVGIRVRTAARAWVTASLRLASGQRAAGRASAHGSRTLWFKVGDATPGDRVIVEVRVSRRARTGFCRASFQPRSAAVPAAPPTTQPAASSSPSSSPAPAPPPTTAASCYPLSNEGTCYEPGEYCRDDDHGVTGVAGDGEKIICEDNDGWRWEPV